MTDKEREAFILKRPHAIFFDDKSRMAKQSFKEQCDVKRIVEIFQKTGQLIHGSNRSPMYGDFSKVPDFKDAMIARIHAGNYFDALPGDVKSKFSSVDEFFAFVSDSKNRDEMVKLGLLKKNEVAVEKVVKVEVISTDESGVVPDSKVAKPKASVKAPPASS